MDEEAPFRRVANALRADIASGACPTGDLLPSQTMVARRHGVSRMTAARAINTLKVEGLVRSRPGVGTFVAAQPPKARDVADELHNIADELHNIHERLEALEQMIKNLSHPAPPGPVF